MTHLIFFDTEFTDLGMDSRLISIGLVSEDGERTFYAELSDTYAEKDCGDFARMEVLPLLEGGSARISMRELAIRLRSWLADFRQPVQLATDSLSWDWPWIKTLFDTPEAWPDNVDRTPLILTQSTEFNEAVEAAFESGLRQHHSLDDAKANRLAWLRISTGSHDE